MLSTGQQSLTPSPLLPQRLHATITHDQFISRQEICAYTGPSRGKLSPHCPLREFGPQSRTLALPRLSPPKTSFVFLLHDQRPSLPVSLLLVGIQGLFVHACWTLCLHPCGQWFELRNNTQAREEDPGPPGRKFTG